MGIKKTNLIHVKDETNRKQLLTKMSLVQEMVLKHDVG